MLLMRLFFLLLLLPAPVFAQLELKPPPRPPKPTTFPEIVITPERAAVLQKGGMVPINACHLKIDGECVSEGLSCVRKALGKAGLSGKEGVLLMGKGTEVGRAFWLLEWAGVPEVKVVEGGRLKSRSRRETRFEAPPREEAAADAEWVRTRFGEKGTEILDLRDEGIWMEKEYEAPPRWAAGHVPHALPFDFRRWLPEKGRWPEPGEPWETLDRLGPRNADRDRIEPEAEIVLYGEGPGDSLPGLGYLLLRRMDRQVRVFPGGFKAWAADGTSPVVRVLGAPEVARLLGIDDPRGKTDAALIDLREPGDYSRLGHLPGAVNHPAYDERESLETFMAARWPVGTASRIPIVLYCYGRGCIRSRNTATHLARMGYMNLVWFREGWPGWLDAGLPVVEEPR
ncbi:MAG TPA: rhodanese-like domain-containing protein [Thermoanaerobaculia bacterium]